jgi:ABC-2 type transport system permease protein
VLGAAEATTAVSAPELVPASAISFSPTKEFLALLKDKKGRKVYIGPPIIQLIVFGYAVTFGFDQVPYSVINEDSGAPARQLLQRVKGSSAFRLKGYLQSDRHIAPLIDTKKVLLVLHMGLRFTEELPPDRTARLQVIIDGRNYNTAMLVWPVTCAPF